MRPERAKERLSLQEMQKAQREERRWIRMEKAAKARDAKIDRQQRIICERVSCGQSMLTILTEGDRTLPKYSTALQWLSDYPDFAEAYRLAQRARSDVLFEEALIISDDARNDWMARYGANSEGWLLNGENIARSKLRVDTRKWAAAKLNPARYGEKLAVETNERPLVVSVTHKIVQVVRQETAPLIEHEHERPDDPDAAASDPDATAG